jgi:hypothetical protein
MTRSPYGGRDPTASLTPLDSEPVIAQAAAALRGIEVKKWAILIGSPWQGPIYYIPDTKQPILNQSGQEVASVLHDTVEGTHLPVFLVHPQNVAMLGAIESRVRFAAPSRARVGAKSIAPAPQRPCQPHRRPGCKKDLLSHSDPISRKESDIFGKREYSMGKHRRQLLYTTGAHVHGNRRMRQLFIVLLTLLAAAAGSIFVTSALFHAAQPFVY